jgi:hypothetical protein
MVIGERFAWAHLPKTAGSATTQLFRLFPELIVFGDFGESNDKHTPFSKREPQIGGKVLAMNFRRLPFWVLSRAQHVARWGVYPNYEPIAMPTPDELSESPFPDSRLSVYTDGGRFPIDRWLRTESLTEDFLAFISEFTEVTDERRASVVALGPVNAHEYDHSIERWFTPAQIATMYERNPDWAALERGLYGGLYEPGVHRQDPERAAGGRG